MKRTEGKNKANYKSKDFFKYYIKNVTKIKNLKGEETRGSYEVDQITFTNIIRDINNEISELMILNNFEYKLPLNLGLVSVKKTKLKFKLNNEGKLITKGLPVNWKQTKELWEKNETAKNNKQLIFFENEHTNGYKHWFCWSKSWAYAKGISIYSFKPCRGMSRRLAECLKNKELKLDFFIH